MDVNKPRLCNTAFRHLGAFMRWGYALNAVIQKRLTHAAADLVPPRRYAAEIAKFGQGESGNQG